MNLSKKGKKLFIDGSGNLVVSKNDFCINVDHEVRNTIIRNWNFINTSKLSLKYKIKYTLHLLKFIWGK